ncbi:MAG TPA: universal stress protein [Longimicrobiales bacterium]
MSFASRIPVYRRVLVPLDGSPFGEQALPYAEAVARAARGRIVLVHAHELPVDIEGVAIDLASDAVMRDRARAYLEEVAAAIASRADVPVATRPMVGRPAVMVEVAVRDVGAELVVMSTHGRTGLARAWLGSVADELVRRLEVPLLLVRPAERGGRAGERVEFEEIVVALDGSLLSERILPHAAAFGRPDRTRYTLVRVVPPELVVGGHVLRLDEARARELVSKAEAYLSGVAGTLRPQAAEVRTRVVKHTAPAAVILEVAAAAGADLIAMTTHGYGGLKRLMLGSTSDKVLRGADVPVLVNRPGE